jgi:serine/threonine-protein kinase
MSSWPELRDYRVLGRIAVGGMAEIYRAHATGGPLAGHEVVLKRLLPVYAGEPGYVELFLAEARLGVLFAHPNIVRTHDLVRSGRDFFIVQEWVRGETLGTLRARAREQGGQLDLSAGLVAVVDLLEALRHLHSGAGLPGQTPIIHRDVNPANLVVSVEGLAKLIDFGVAERQGSAVQERTGALRGTPAYMSPEQVKGRPPLDARSDLFSAGIVLWELFADEPLFEHEGEFETLRRVAEEAAPPLRMRKGAVPTSFERLCVRALAKDRDRRFQSADEFLAALHEAIRREGLPLDRARLAAEVHRLAAPRAA